MTGRKVGFANKAMWRILKLPTLVWGHMYDDTVHYANGNFAEISLPKARSLKIEPEIMFGLKRPITEDLDAAAALDACEWIAFGFEIIDCPFPGLEISTGRFRRVARTARGAGRRRTQAGHARTDSHAPRAAAVIQGTHVEKRRIRGRRIGQEFLAQSRIVPGGAGDAVLKRGQPPLGTGEIISSGTLTAGHLLAKGDTWSAELQGLPLPNLSFRLG